MNTCASYVTLLDGYIDGILSPEDMKLVEKHLDSCPDCKQYVEDILAIEADFPTVDEVAVPEHFAQSVMAEVAKHPRKTKKVVHWHRFALPAVACLAVVVYVGGRASDGADQMMQDNFAMVSSSSADVNLEIQDRAVADIVEEELDMASSSSSSAVSGSTRDTGTAVPETMATMPAMYQWPQSQVGDILADQEGVDQGDGTLAYTLDQETFFQLLEQLALIPEDYPQQESYWVVVTSD